MIPPNQDIEYENVGEEGDDCMGEDVQEVEALE